MLHSISEEHDSRATGRVIDDLILADGLIVADPELVREAKELEDSAAVGVKCQRLMNLGVAASRVTGADKELRSVQDASARFEKAVETTVENAVGSIAKEFTAFTNPDDGILTKSITNELERILDGLGSAFDPDDKKSILTQIESAVTKAGERTMTEMSNKVRKLVDPDNENSPMGQLRASIARDLRDPLAQLTESMDKIETLISVERAVETEANRGTAKGSSYEDTVGAVLGEIAIALGDEVARTSDESGVDGNSIGDYVTTNGASPSRVAWEVKDSKSITRPKVLAELNNAASNRDAPVSVMVISHDGKLTNGAPYIKLAPARYVVVYDKTTREDLALRVVYQLVRAEALMATSSDDASIDPPAIAAKIEEARKLLDKVISIKRDLSSAENGIRNARTHVEELKDSLGSILDEVTLMVDSTDKLRSSER